MPLVFLHGVNVRKGGDYDKIVSRRDSLFRQFALKQVVSNWEHFEILNPYWGDDAAQFRWNHVSLPTGNEEILGGLDVETSLFLAKARVFPTQADKALLEVARAENLTAAVDLLWMVAAHVGANEESTELARLAEQLLTYASANPHPQWLAEVTDDGELITAFKRESTAAPPSPTSNTGTTISQPEVLGISAVWNSIREAGGRIATAVPAAASAAVLAIARRSLHRTIATFLGDVMVYLNQRDLKGPEAPILKTVLASIDAADNIRNAKGEPLIVVAHSMGGNIMYDILTHFRPNVRIDMFATVGSQLALLEELKLFTTSDPEIPKNRADRVTAPPSAQRWLNIFDANDILSFAAARVFTAVSDYEYETGKDVFHAHSSYFNQPSFQKRLGARIQEAWTK